MRNATSSDQRSITAVVVTALGTAALAWFFDPRSGRRRRAILRDKTGRTMRRGYDLFGKAAVDLQHRAQGLYHEAAGAVAPEGADDTTLVSRVRTRLGRVCSHPRAIEVFTEDGTVRLKGDILEGELAGVLRAVKHVRGVHGVVNELTTHEHAGNIPRLQGEGHRPARSEFVQEHWAPGPRLIAAVGGLALIGFGLARRSLAGTAAAIGGTALLTRSIVNAPLSKQLGLDEGGQGVQIEKTLRVQAQPQEVYSFWRNPENFPRFMRHVRSVRKVGDNLYHWKVMGPGGVPVEWNAEISADVPGQLIAWRTLEDAPVSSSGIVQFEPDEPAGTRLHVRMSYRPPGNVVGHTVARILGADPRRQMDEDLLRFKSYIEAATPPTLTETMVRH